MAATGIARRGMAVVTRDLGERGRETDRSPGNIIGRIDIPECVPNTNIFWTYRCTVFVWLVKKTFKILL